MYMWMCLLATCIFGQCCCRHWAFSDCLNSTSTLGLGTLWLNFFYAPMLSKSSHNAPTLCHYVYIMLTFWPCHVIHHMSLTRLYITDLLKDLRIHGLSYMTRRDTLRTISSLPFKKWEWCLSLIMLSLIFLAICVRSNHYIQIIVLLCSHGKEKLLSPKLCQHNVPRPTLPTLHVHFK